MRPTANTTYLYAVETDIPIPLRRFRSSSTGEPIYPFKLLDVGNSFFVPSGDTGAQLWLRINAAINVRQQKSNVRYCWRHMEKSSTDKTMGYRVWRTM